MATTTRRKKRAPVVGEVDKIIGQRTAVTQGDGPVRVLKPLVRWAQLSEQDLRFDRWRICRG
jgi:hypothetical protein